MELRDIGEREAIKIMAGRYGSVNLDDCATIDAGDEFFLVTTDMVNEKTHFPEGATPYQMGWFVVAINLSDIAAKGGVPVGVVLSVGLPGNEDVDFIKEFSRGADDCAKKFGTKIIGGDTKEMDSVTISGTAIGRVKKSMFMPRRGCRPGDVVCVTGELGRAGAALESIRNGEGDTGKSLNSILLVNPRMREGSAAASTGGVTASMDISDGLSSSLYQLMDINDTGFSIIADKIPVFGGGGDGFKHALHSGGDYELLFTISPDRLGDVNAAVNGAGCRLTEIGTVIGERKVILVRRRAGGMKRPNGSEGEGIEEMEMENRGYEHFSGRGKTL